MGDFSRIQLVSFREVTLKGHGLKIFEESHSSPLVICAMQEIQNKKWPSDIHLLAN